MSILDASLASAAMAGEGAKARARRHYPDAHEGEICDAGRLIDALICNERPTGILEHRWSIVACFMGFDPAKQPNERGFEPTRPPSGFEDNPIGFTAKAIDIAIALACISGDPWASASEVVSRVCANILLKLKDRGRENWRIRSESRNDWSYPAESDIARVRRMLEVATGLPRDTIRA